MTRSTVAIGSCSVGSSNRTCRTPVRPSGETGPASAATTWSTSARSAVRPVDPGGDRGARDAAVGRVDDVDGAAGELGEAILQQLDGLGRVAAGDREVDLVVAAGRAGEHRRGHQRRDPQGHDPPTAVVAPAHESAQHHVTPRVGGRGSAAGVEATWGQQFRVMAPMVGVGRRRVVAREAALRGRAYARGAHARPMCSAAGPRIVPVT